MTEYQSKQQIVEWLKEYEAIKAGIENLEQTIEDIAQSDMAVNYDKEPTGKNNKFNSIVESAVVKIDKLDIKRRIEAMKNIVNNIDRALSILTDTERFIIEHRCIKSQYYYQFCYQINVSERTAKRIKKEALRKMSIVIFGKE